MPIAAEWLRFCINGGMLDLYRAPMTKLRLTMTCQCCGRKFGRPMDLSLHLMTAHAALWHAAQATLGILVSTFYSKCGCICNPVTNAQRSQHICVPFKQLAMQFHRQTHVPLMPILLTDEDIATLISPRLPRNHRFVLEQLLADRRFEAFWMDPSILQITRAHCLLCGQAHAPAALCHHITRDHFCAHVMITYFLNQLLPLFLKRNDADHRCASCMQISTVHCLKIKLTEVLKETSWFKSTCGPIVLACCSLVCSLLQLSMDAWMVEAATEQTQAAMQIWEAFQEVTPFLDKGLKLEPDPRQPKRPRGRGKEPQPPQGGQGHDDQKVLAMMKLMASLLIRHDQDWQSLKRNDSFVLFFSKEPSGTLTLMMQAAAQWRQQQELKGSSTLKLPLRQHLMVTLLNDLLTRVTAVSKATKTDKLYQVTVKNQIILEDYSWPFLQWCPQSKMNKIGPKKAIGMQQMLNLCQELLEHFRNPEVIVKFHSLRDTQDNPIVPWRLQMNMRLDDPYNLMCHLCYNSMWTLIGTQLKPHLQHQSPMATALQNMLGKGKGRGKGQNSMTAKSETT
eukprot:s1590_g13.t1